MATATRTTNRRALLGAIGMAPVAVLVAAAPMEAAAPKVDRRAWERAYARWEKASNEWERLSAAAMPGDDFGPDEAWAALDARVPALQAERDAFMEVPAPDTAALLVKLEVWAVSLDARHAETTMADARRLLSREA